MVEILTERLILRPWQESDAESLYYYAKNPKVGPAAGWQSHKSVEESLTILKNFLITDNDESEFAPENYAVCLKEDNKAIGSISLKVSEEIERSEMEIGYWLGVSHWGQGYIPEAAETLIERAFKDVGCTALWCVYTEQNEKSKSVAQKIGFSYHHTEYDKLNSRLNEKNTEIYTRLTKDEWLNQ